MTTVEQYLAAQFPDTYNVLGRRMAVFTLGHAMLLQRLKSPFVWERQSAEETPPAPGYGDLRLAIALCARSYPRALALAEGRPWRSLWTAPVLWRFVRCPRRRLLEGSVQMYRYLAAARQMPECWPSQDDNSRQAGSPFLQLVKLTQMMHLGKTEMQALCTPYALARWDYAACWEIEGRIKIVSQDDRQGFERAKELHDRRAASVINHQRSTIN